MCGVIANYRYPRTDPRQGLWTLSERSHGVTVNTRVLGHRLTVVENRKRPGEWVVRVDGEEIGRSRTASAGTADGIEYIRGLERNHIG